MSNLVLAILAGLGNGVGDFFTKLTAGRISLYLAAILVSLSAGLTVAIYLIFFKGLAGNLQVTKMGVLYAVLSGVSIGVGMVFFFGMFNKGANISQTLPIVKSVVVLSAVLLGVIVLKEKMNVYQVIGILFSIAGIYFLTK